MAVGPGTGSQRASYDSQSFDLFNIAQQQVDAAFREQGFDEVFKMPESMKDIDAPALFTSAAVGPGDELPSPSAPAVSARAMSAPAAAAMPRGSSRGPQAQQQPAAKQARPNVPTYQARPLSQTARPASAQRPQSSFAPPRKATAPTERKRWNWMLFAGIILTVLGGWFIGVPLLVAAIVRKAIVEREEKEVPGSSFTAARESGTRTVSGAQFTMPDGGLRARGGSRKTRTSSSPTGPNTVTPKVIALVIAIMATTAIIAFGVVLAAFMLDERAASTRPAMQIAPTLAGQTQETVETLEPQWCSDRSRVVRTQNAYLKVGKDMPAGVYVLETVPGDNGYYEVCTSDSGSLNDVLFNDFTATFTLVEVVEGEFLKLDGYVAYPVDCYARTVDASSVEPGAYRVGIDIPVGSYRFEVLQSGDTDRAFIGRYSSAHRTVGNVIDFEMFSQARTIALREGECVFIEGARGTVVTP